MPDGLRTQVSRVSSEPLCVAKHEHDLVATIDRLQTELAAQSSQLGELEAALAHSRRIFERASSAARIGIWECSLPDEALHWTDGTYDLFDLPRGSALDRGEILKCYSEASRRALAVTRSRAIEERSGFNLDVEITTVKGNRRWIRLTATVECEDGVPVRIFGIKQDITEEKLLWERTRYLAEFDVMTGLANRSQFQAKLQALCGSRSDGAASGALLLIDLDGFKEVNDTYGHAEGDECLKEAARRLGSVCHAADLVARVGGDEFAVLLGSSASACAVEDLAARIVEAMGRPLQRGGRSFRLGASVGIAQVEAAYPSELFKRADLALYAAKAAGRNTFRTFTLDMMAA